MQNWYFRNGEPMPSSFRIAGLSKDGKSAIAVSPRGSRPRVYTPARLMELDAAIRAKKLAAEKAAVARFQADAEPPFKLAMVKARLIASSGVPKDYARSNWLTRLHRQIASDADLPATYYGDATFGEKRRGYLIQDVERYEQACAILKADLEKTKAARDDPRLWIRSGRYRVTGVILHAAWKETDFGTTAKMTLQLDTGAKLYGTIPQTLLDLSQEVCGDIDLAAMRGLTVSITATVQPSKEDRAFGFFSRPSKAVAETALTPA